MGAAVITFGLPLLLYIFQTKQGTWLTAGWWGISRHINYFGTEHDHHLLLYVLLWNLINTLRMSMKCHGREEVR
ncbi:uncharacterized protein AFUA_5G10350 [Aspergillus fumigatus Af293]|uniref:Integral membrane protein n=2 Tax=Aspergillus fumigatus TaxID=746128 RepID=Q4WV07_ASPFU|nr:conserved hypothetical protein [Aspergillus fumigatus Af293]EAL91569.1 conserved hypothetical protein [Aspergillus fumigatus Af293]EDP51774.1 conserved hypothetical protein [Aspergillus fumigatus A1163]